MLSGQATKRDAISSKRFFAAKCVYTQGHGWSSQPYRFEPERVSNHEDIENDEVNNWLEGTFWCTCEQCKVMLKLVQPLFLQTFFLLANYENKMFLCILIWLIWITRGRTRRLFLKIKLTRTAWKCISEPEAFWTFCQIQVWQNDVTFSGLGTEPCIKMAANDVEFWASLETNFSG